MEQTFLRKAICLLEEIETSWEKKEWCEHYSVYTQNPGQQELENSLDDFADKAYQVGLVITNYHQVIELYALNEEDIARAESDWLKQLPYMAVLSCIAYHFRRDHFDNGALINDSIAGGAMLRMLKRLRELSFGPNIATTLETLYRFDCEGIPNEPGVYWILAPEGFNIRFRDTSANSSAPFYAVETLKRKYANCRDKQVLYIGKANGRKGLRQRIRQYMKYGWNKAKNHKGGRAIWQIENAEMLLLTYVLCSDCEEREHQLLKEYWEKNGRYPLANWKG